MLRWVRYSKNKITLPILVIIEFNLNKCLKRESLNDFVKSYVNKTIPTAYLCFLRFNFLELFVGKLLGNTVV